MAQNVLTQVIIEAIYKDKASGPARETEKNLQALFEKIKSGAQAFAGLVAATYSLKKAFDFTVECVRLAARLDDLRMAFQNLSRAQNLNADLMLGKMREAAAGQINDIDLLQAANNALLLGIPITEDSMARLIETGRRLGRAMGLDAKAGVESLITGIGRQSRLMLDNLGIIVDVEKANREYAQSLGKTAESLTEAEQKIAFYNAVIAQTEKSMQNLGPEIRTATDTFNEFAINVTNLKIAFGELFSTASTDVFNVWARNFKTTFLEVFSEIGRQNLAKNIEEIRQKMWTWGSDLKTIQPILRELTATLQQAGIPDEVLRRFKYFMELSPSQFVKSAYELNEVLLQLQNELQKPHPLENILPQKTTIFVTDEFTDELKRLRQEIIALSTTDYPIDSFQALGAEFKEIQQMIDAIGKEDPNIKLIKSEFREFANWAEKVKSAWVATTPPPSQNEQIRAVAQTMEGFANSLSQAFIYGQKIGPALVSSLKAIAAQLAAKAAIYGLMALFTGGTSSLAGLLTAGKSTSFLGYLFGGAFQSGGIPPVGVPYLVGEHGPELRIDTRPGVILPNQVVSTLSRDQSAQELRRLRADFRDLARQMERLKYSVRIGDQEIYASHERVAASRRANLL